jgi:hypothetical protein
MIRKAPRDRMDNSIDYLKVAFRAPNWRSENRRISGTRSLHDVWEAAR